MESLQWRRRPEIADFCPLSRSNLSWIPETLFYVTEMRFSKIIIPKQYFHEILWVRIRSGSRKRGVEFKGGSLHDGFGSLTVLAVLESTLPSFCWSYKIQHNEATVAVLTVLAVSAVMAVSVMTATPLKLNSPFPSSWVMCTPAGNYCETNSGNTLLCNWNEIFQDNRSQTIFPWNSLSKKQVRVM